METECYGSLCLEGGDQVGKADATNRLVEELEKQDINLTFTSFPIYSTPIGTSIRHLLKNGCPEEILSKVSSLETRIALFALNRLEYMDVILGSKKYCDTFLLFDRSPFSNALTISYGLSSLENMNPDEVANYIDLSLNYDSLVISKLGLDRCVVQLQSKKQNWDNIRVEEGDQYEREEVQEKCDYVYEGYKKIVGDGWHQVVTKDENGWRKKNEIFNSINNILLSTYGDMGDIRKGKRYQIGFKEIIERMYPKSKYGENELKKYYEALRDNLKDQMYSNGVLLGKQVANTCSEVKIRNEEVRIEFRRIIWSVPETLNVMRYFLGDNFVNKLLEEIER